MADCEADDSTAPKAKEAPLRDPRLRAAAALIERLQGNAHAANTRGAALHVLEAVTEALRAEIPELDWLALLTPLDCLQSALRDLDAGGHPAMLAPVKRSGRAPADAMMIELKARVAAMVDCLCGLDDRASPLTQRRQRACREIAAVLTECGVTPQRAGARDQRGIGAVTPRTVRGWFDEAVQAPKSAALARRYNSLRELNKWSADRACDAMLAVFGHALPASELAVRRRRAELSFLRAWITDLST